MFYHFLAPEGGLSTRKNTGMQGPFFLSLINKSNESAAKIYPSNKYNIYTTRTSDGGIGNHNVSLPIILIKIKFDQMLLPSYICSLLVSI